MNPVLLVARREVTTRTQARGYRIGLLVTVVVVAVLACLPAVLRGTSSTHYTVGVASALPGAATLGDALRAEGTARGARVTVRALPPGRDARAAVRDGDLDAAVTPAGLVATNAGDDVVAVVQSAAVTAQVLDRLRQAGLSADRARQALRARPLPLVLGESAQAGQRQAVATVTVVFFFVQLLTFCTWVATGVVEEKSSRVVELLLGALRPVQLLAGKIVGIGGLAIGQAVLVGVVALVAAQLSGSLDLPASVYGTVAVSFLWFVLGFAFFATLAAALGSLVSHQEEVGGVLTPMTLLSMLTYGASFYTASSPDGTAARVISVVPPLSALAMPARLARGGVPWGDVVGALALMAALVAVTLVCGARIYRASVLSTGRRLSLGAAWRAEPVGSGS